MDIPLSFGTEDALRMLASAGIRIQLQQDENFYWSAVTLPIQDGSIVASGRTIQDAVVGLVGVHLNLGIQKAAENWANRDGAPVAS